MRARSLKIPARVWVRETPKRIGLFSIFSAENHKVARKQGTTGNLLPLFRQSRIMLNQMISN